MFETLWQAWWPAVVYGLTVDGVSVLWGEPGTLMGTMAGAGLAVPVFGYLYRKMEGNVFDGGEPFGPREGLFCVAAGIGACGAVNTLIMAGPLPRYFPGFSSGAEKLYGPGLFVQSAAMGIVIPIAEELVFRGLVFGGLRRKHSFVQAAFLSAAVFGIYHGNVLQGLYGFVMGWALAWVMERKRTIKGAVLMHMGANLASIVLTAGPAWWKTVQAGQPL